MGATFSSVVEAWTTRATGVQVPRAAPAGCDEKEPVSSNVVDAAQVQAPRAAPDGDEKTSWPELVGSNEFDAAQAILQDRHDVRVEYYDCGKNAPPTDFDPNRVALFSNSRFCVVTVPKVG
ncbi:hypothetical protein QYE76_015970 [Lolium multiflorum]|uniref:Uncharacterized protein n=1 Tax=Lolium multiflorum TaxID=4521 RepID=A0AAD8X6W5_LOLMU|nr:hypothetical protein QYE76_015970 [Lolium multiflorum]